MIVLALVLLIIVLLFSVAIVLSNPDVYQLSLFRVLVPVTSAGIFFTGFGAALVTIIALLLLRTGIRRGRETRRRLRAAEGAGSSTAGSGPDDAGDQPGGGSRGEPESGRVDEQEPPHPAEHPAPSSLDLEPTERPTTPADQGTPSDRGTAADRETAGGADEDRDQPRI